MERNETEFNIDFDAFLHLLLCTTIVESITLNVCTCFCYYSIKVSGLQKKKKKKNDRKWDGSNRNISIVIFLHSKYVVASKNRNTERNYFGSKFCCEKSCDYNYINLTFILKLKVARFRLPKALFLSYFNFLNVVTLFEKVR